MCAPPIGSGEGTWLPRAKQDSAHKYARYSSICEGELTFFRRLMGALNVSRATSARVDGHCGDCQHPHGEDCLHYCLPGAVDQWSVALQEAIGVPPVF